MEISELVGRYRVLTGCEKPITDTVKELVTCFGGGGRLFVCGNGGSASDSAHIVGELAKGFMSKRPMDYQSKYRFTSADPELGAALAEKLQVGLPAHNLCENSSLNTAVANDIDPDMIYAQQLVAYARGGDVLLGISTSGNAKNIRYAAVAARALGMTVIGLTGKSGGLLKPHCDICITVPETETYKVQELHLPVYHFICASVEEQMFPQQ